MAKINRQLLRMLDEIEKVEGKIAQWQKYLGELNIRKEQLENQEIIKSIRSVKLGSRELLSVLLDIQSGSIVLPVDKWAQESEPKEEETERPDILEGDAGDISKSPDLEEDTGNTSRISDLKEDAGEASRNPDLEEGAGNISENDHGQEMEKEMIDNESRN